ncbi:DUF397 domain-containing protein [Streptomyces sp. WAC07149]|uniref:DUF397 domain-containing protein n=1 Tax=Streptomyces sp. WAC07149 TaxID=2487425 RepID=UPI000F79E691|nr:DUF397 domain-containing protein [Streptomyces sp. WAC07149]RST01623.1 DUF397 domain-containing protein [Streptomyces sp. WAC07149]
MSTALKWIKSSYSGSNGGNCVEVATTPTPATIHVRDSKVEDGPVLDLGPASWAALTGWVSA